MRAPLVSLVLAVVPLGCGSAPDRSPVLDDQTTSTLDDPQTPGKKHYGLDEAIPNDLSWQGYVGGGTALETIKLSDFADPDGSRGINVIVIAEVTGWCPACRAEARALPTKLADSWEGMGVRVVQLLTQDGDRTPATADGAASWRDEFQATWGVGVDPTFTFAKVGTNYIPEHAVIDPRTMKLYARTTGWSPSTPEIDALARQNSTP